MKTIAQFHENLLTAFVVANVKIIKRIAGHVNGDTLEISVKAEKQGSRHCINSYLYTVSPADKPHHMMIDEVWVGFDSDGCPWSDNMGGQIVDCTGKTVDQAIDLIVETLMKKLAEGD
jgi:hypothetical protein